MVRIKRLDRAVSVKIYPSDSPFPYIRVERVDFGYLITIFFEEQCRRFFLHLSEVDKLLHFDVEDKLEIKRNGFKGTVSKEKHKGSFLVFADETYSSVKIETEAFAKVIKELNKGPWPVNL